MNAIMKYLYSRIGRDTEVCFNIGLSRELNPESMERLCEILRGNARGVDFGEGPFLCGDHVVEIGPRLNFQTAQSETAVDICRASRLPEVLRVEMSRRQVLPVGVTPEAFFAQHGDRMTEQLYHEPLTTFYTGVSPEAIRIILLTDGGIDVLRAANKEMGLGMDEWDMAYYCQLFVETFKRNPTDVELFMIAQMNSEHCRHWFFKGVMVFNGVRMLESLIQVVQAPWVANPNNSVIAFNDNSSAIEGFEARMLSPRDSGRLSSMVVRDTSCNFIFTAETHNHPSGVAPFPGAETGTGGRIRDVQATGRGGLLIAGTAGYCVGQLLIPGHTLPWEDSSLTYPTRLALPLDILIQASNGASDYGNKIGEPVIAGFTRSFCVVMPDGTRREWIKPIMFTGGLGQMDARHVRKIAPQAGDKVVMIGGPAYRIGVGGGAASSMTSGSNDADLDFASVQRGNAEMANRVNRVVRACIEMGDNNPIKSVHDQGAGGVANVVTELVSPAGARIDIRSICVGDQTLSVLEIWSAEYQERLALLTASEDLEALRLICGQEKVPCEVLGEVTGDGRIVVVDSGDNNRVLVDLELAPILGDVPQKKFHFDRLLMPMKPLALPSECALEYVVRRVLQLLDVGSKRFLTSKVDRSVTGLIIQQQCCGPVQLPVADCAVVAQSFFGDTGAVTSIGERPAIMLIDPAAGARMAVAEMLLNMVGTTVTSLEDIRCSANEMWAAKMAGEGPRMWDALCAMRDIMLTLGIAVDGGKDSLSMAVKVGDETVKAPGQLVISGYAPVPDVSKVVTPDIKRPGESRLWLIDLSLGGCRLGGSALARVYGQLGDEAPDVDNPDLLKRTFLAVQELVREGLVLSCHDRGDGGLLVTLLEMAFSGNCGLEVDMSLAIQDGQHPFVPTMFNEELGLVMEVSPENEGHLVRTFFRYGITHCLRRIGVTSLSKTINIRCGGQVLSEDMRDLRQAWEETSSLIELERAMREGLSEGVIREERESIYDQQNPVYVLTFEPKVTSREVMEASGKPKVAVIREEGTNGDRELAAVFYEAGFEVWDVAMSDLLNGCATLDDFRMVAFAGGFSYGDVTGSANGWASVIRHHPEISAMFERFRNRPDTLSFGVCNGCQLLVALGWVSDDILPHDQRPRLVHNVSGRFESRWVTVEILGSPAVMLRGMEGSKIGVWSAHGEGRFENVPDGSMTPVVFVDDQGDSRTERYPFNPNGSTGGVASMCSWDGRHLAMMPHPERAFQMRQWAYVSPEMQGLEVAPWLRMFQNARKWIEQNG